MSPRPVDDDHARRLAALPFWPGPIAVAPLAGGITNRNYRVDSGGTSYVARFCEPREVLGIDRRNEVVCQRAAHALGVAPGVVYDEGGVLVSEYVEAKTLGPADVRDPALMRRVAEMLRRLHDGWDRVSGETLYFSVFQTVRTYAETARGLGAILPSDIEDLVEDARFLSRRIAPFVPALCHNDMLPANILDDGRRVWLVDWEYAGFGHPLFDLAGVSANCQFTASLDAAFLAAYRESEGADSRDIRELRILKAMSLLREALWSVIQTVASDLAFDYREYAETNFRAHREASGAVEER